MAKSTNKTIIQLKLRLLDPESSQEELAETTHNVRRELLDGDVENAEPVRTKSALQGAKVVEPFTLGLLALKLVASGGALTGMIAVARSWVQGRANRTVVVQRGKDKLTVKGASSKQQERLIGEWITRTAKDGPADIKTKPRISRKSKKATKRSARR